MSLARNDLAEKALLSSVFSNPEVIGEVAEIIQPDDFFEPKNELIYQTTLKLYQAGKDYSPVSVVSDLKREGNLQRAGDIPYLREIVDPSEMSSMGADPLGFAFLVKEAARLRSLSKAAEKISEVSVMGTGLTSDEALQVAETEIMNIVNQEASSDSMHSVAELLPEVINDIRNAETLPEGVINGIPTGFLKFDEMTSGFKGGQMIIIAARPAVGKSTLAVDFGRNAAFLAGKTVLFFSLEMAAKELVNRILSAEARVETQKIVKGDLTETDWMNIAEARQKLDNGTFLIDSNPKTSLSRVRSIATRQKLKPEGLDMIIIDYLQLMDIPQGMGRAASRQEVVSETSRGIKILAKELNIPIIILSQLNRKSEERQDGKPMVSDLRESGSLEQDADMVLLIHRPEASDQNNRPGEADLIVAKNRGGPSGTVPLTSMLAYSKFVPGQGLVGREPELSSDGESGEFGTTEDEIPW